MQKVVHVCTSRERVRTSVIHSAIQHGLDSAELQELRFTHRLCPGCLAEIEGAAQANQTEQQNEGSVSVAGR